MAERRTLVRREEPEEEEIPEEDVDVEEDADVDEDDEEAPAPAPVRKVVAPPPAPLKKVVTATVKASPAPVAAPRKIVVPAPVAKKAAPVVEEVEEDVIDVKKVASSIKVQKVGEMVVDDLLGRMLEALVNGDTILFTKQDNSWLISNASTKAVAKAVRQAGRFTGQAYWTEVCTPEFLEHEAEWNKLTQPEKIAACKKIKATWVHVEDPRVEVIRITSAYREAAGIAKYKPQYVDRKAREAIRG